VGAARRHIVLEVIAEGVIISIIGGLTGLAIAAAVLEAANAVGGFDAALQGSTALGSVLAAAAAGLLASWYPARRAAAFDVVSALHED
jgi:ABC-type antimicrobial peptide transport system permease subunit